MRRGGRRWTWRLAIIALVASVAICSGLNQLFMRARENVYGPYRLNSRALIVGYAAIAHGEATGEWLQVPGLLELGVVHFRPPDYFEAEGVGGGGATRSELMDVRIVWPTQPDDELLLHGPDWIMTGYMLDRLRDRYEPCHPGAAVR